MKLSRKSLAGIAVVGALTLGATIPAIAQDGSEEPSESVEESQGRGQAIREQRHAMREQRHELRAERQAMREEHKALRQAQHQQVLDRVAEILGVSPADLAAAMEQAKDELGEQHRAEREELGFGPGFGNGMAFGHDKADTEDSATP